MKGMDKAMKSFAALDKAIEFHHTSSAGTVVGLAANATRIAKLHDDMVPSGIRTMLELNRKLQRMVDPLGFGRLGLANLRMDALTESTRIVQQVSRMGRSLHDQRLTFEPHGTIAALVASGAPWRELSRVSENLGVGNALTSQISQMRRLDRGLGRLLGIPAHDAWSAHLKALAVPSMSFLSHNWERPVALVAELAAPDLGASVSWLVQHRGEPLVMTAALLPEVETLNAPSVVTEGEPVCAFCGRALISLGHTLKWHGPKRGTKHCRLFPACLTCMEGEHDYLLERLEELTQPVLYGIKGGGRGDGIPAGTLRLVRTDDDP